MISSPLTCAARPGERSDAARKVDEQRVEGARPLEIRGVRRLGQHDHLMRREEALVRLGLARGGRVELAPRDAHTSRAGARLRLCNRRGPSTIYIAILRELLTSPGEPLPAAPRMRIPGPRDTATQHSRGPTHPQFLSEKNALLNDTMSDNKHQFVQCMDIP